MWVSNPGHGPGLRGRLGRLCTIQGTQVRSQVGTGLLQSVWLKLWFTKEGEGVLFCFALLCSRSYPKVSFKLALFLSEPTEFPQFVFHRKRGRVP